MNHLMRELAPVTDEAWTQIDEEATRSLKHYLAARRLVDFTGPLGWDHSAVDTGRIDVLAIGSLGAVEVARRRVAAPDRVAIAVLTRSGRAGRRRPRGHRPRPRRGHRRRARRRPGRGPPRLPRLRGGRRRRDHPGVAPREGGHQRRLQPLSRARGPGRGRPPVRRHRRALRHRPRSPVLHRRHRDHRAWRLSGVRAPPPDPRRPGGVGTGGGRSRRPQPAGWRLRARPSARTSPSATAPSTPTSVDLYIEESLTFRINTADAAVHLAYL